MFFRSLIMHCQRLFLLFTGKQHCLHNFFSGGGGGGGGRGESTCNEYLSSCKISRSVVCYGFGSTALQQD